MFFFIILHECDKAKELESVVKDVIVVNIVCVESIYFYLLYLDSRRAFLSKFYKFKVNLSFRPM